MWEEIAFGQTDGRTEIDKLLYRLQILASYNNPRIGQDSEFAQFSPRALVMSKLTLKQYFLKVLERLIEFLYHCQD